MGHSSVAIVESNEVTRNNTNVTDVGGDIGTDFMDMIDFSKVEEMHGGDNGGESEPTHEHYLSQMGEQNQYNVAGVNDGEAYLDTRYSRSDWNPKIQVGQILGSVVDRVTVDGIKRPL
ncbi:hypothetical protein L3X38_011058 [Prunus dulcis]|uniref:Uncharacterized protein n=1 Tax=Prunus dulcis TaxID=3755 RepID=A0AAD4WIX7_PRUDU|nr:hypothetical protein L3X38_011058 [Prunus dulcis]